MNILFILFNPVGKGTYWRGLFLARGLAQQGHKVTVMATSRHRRFKFYTRSDEHPNVTIVETPDLLWGPLRFGWDIWNTAARIIWSFTKHFDLVHAFESRPVVIFPALYWQRIRGVTLLLDWCDWFGKGGSVEERSNWAVRTILRPFETFFEDQFRTWADGTTVINSTLCQRAITLGVPPDRIKYLPNGSNIDELFPYPKTKAREELGLDQNILIIGYLGAIFLRDAHLMANAFDMVYQSESRVRLLLIGYCNIPIESYSKYPEAIHSTESIPYDKINTYLAACDICWLPLNDTGANRGRFPLKINDYMAAGKPVVATDVGDIGTLVQTGAFGVVSLDQPEDISEQTLRLLYNPAQCNQMGQHARQFAEIEFNWTDISKRLMQHYKYILTQINSSKGDTTI